MSKFLIIGSIAVNLAHVTDVKYTPYQPAHYNEEHRCHKEESPAYLKLWLTSLASCIGEGGSVSESRTITIKGPEAEATWLKICNLYLDNDA